MPGNVFELPKGQKKMDFETEARLRRLAVQIATQLPENVDEARRVLALTDVLLADFLSRPTPF